MLAVLAARNSKDDIVSFAHATGFGVSKRFENLLQREHYSIKWVKIRIMTLSV